MKSLHCTLTIICALFSLSSLVHAAQVTGIAATVNGEVITTNEVHYHLTPYRQQLDAAMPRKGPQYNQLIGKARTDILNNLIERELILSEFNIKLGGSIPAHVIDSEIDRQVRTLYNNSRAEFNKSLREAGVAPQKHRKETEKKLIVQSMRSRQFSNTVPPLPDEINAEYHKHKLKMRDTTGDKIDYHNIYILKSDPSNPMVTPKLQLELAESIVKQLRDGADFAELAKKHSVDSYAQDGGKVTKQPRIELSPAFASILMETPDGKVLDPLEDGRGFTIVRVDKKHYGPVPPLSKVRKNIESRVRTRKNKAKHDRWMQRMRAGAMIKTKI